MKAPKLDRRTAGLIWGATYETLSKANLPKDKFPDGWLMATLKKETMKDAMDLLYNVVKLKIQYQEVHINKLIEEGLII